MADRINALDLNLLKVFRALYESRNATRAAARVGLTQPSVSRALQKLRLTFSDPLFEWKAAEMRPTPLAHSLFPLIAGSLDAAEAVLSKVDEFDPMRTETNFVLGMTDYVCAVMMGELARHIRKTAPGVTLTQRPIAAFEACQALCEGQVEFAVVSQKPNEPEVDCQPLFSDDYVVLADARRHDPPGATFPLTTYVQLKHVLVSYAGGRWGWIDDVLEDLGYSRRLEMVVGSFSAVPDLVLDSDMVAAVPRRLAATVARSTPLRVFDLPFPSMTLHFHLAWKRRGVLTPAQRWLSEQIHWVCEGLDAP